MGRIIISWPTHPAYYMLYFILFFPILLIAPTILSEIFLFTGIGLRASLLLSTSFLTASLMLSFVNISLKEISSFPPRIEFILKYVYFWGIPIPMIYPRVIISRIVIALNIGGGLLPLLINTYLLINLLFRSAVYFVEALIIVFFVAIITFYASRAIPGVGIVVPGFIPPIASVLLTVLLIHSLDYAIPVSFIGGSLGSLIGADIFRLKRDLDKFVKSYGGAILSIGGAGTFDGIFLSGVFSVVFTYLFY